MNILPENIDSFFEISYILKDHRLIAQIDGKITISGRSIMSFPINISFYIYENFRSR